MAFGIRNVPDRLKALREFSRILAKPTESAPAAEGLSGNVGVGRAEERTGVSSSSISSVVAILELQNPESGLLASASRAFIKWVTFAFWFIVGALWRPSC